MWDLFLSYRDEGQYIASLALGLAMWRSGSGPERAVAVVFVCFVIAPSLVGRLLGIHSFLFGSAAWMYVLFDGLAAAGFLIIAMGANRNYPMWVAGFQLVAMSAHVVRGMVDGVSPMAYVILAVGPSYCQLLLLFAGYSRHLWRQRIYGDYRDWRIGTGPAGLWLR